MPPKGFGGPPPKKIVLPPKEICAFLFPPPKKTVLPANEFCAILLRPPRKQCCPPTNFVLFCCAPPQENSVFRQQILYYNVACPPKICGACFYLFFCFNSKDCFVLALIPSFLSFIKPDGTLQSPWVFLYFLKALNCSLQ